MVDIARLNHPTYSNDPRILPWCAALPEVSDCSSASVTPARARCRCRSRVKAQIEPRVLHADVAGRDHCPARRVGQSALLRRLLDLPTVGITQRPLLAAGSSPADSRGPSACCRSATGRRVLGADPSKRPSARRPPRLAGEPAHRSGTRPGRHRPPPHTRARCAVPATAPGLLAQRHPRTTARGNVRRHHRYPVAPPPPNRIDTKRPGAHRVRRPQPHQDHTAQHQPAKPRHRGAAVATATIEITAGQLDPAAVGDLLILLKYEMQS